jgi:hypothetical protein
MSVIRTIVLSAATLFLGLSAMFMVTGTAAAAETTQASIQCDTDWHTPCP